MMEVTGRKKNKSENIPVIGAKCIFRIINSKVAMETHHVEEPLKEGRVGVC